MHSKLKTQSAITRIINVCIGLTFIPIMLIFVFWIVSGSWAYTYESFLTRDLLRDILFILIPDLSMIAGGKVVSLSYPILTNRIGIRLSASVLIMLLATSTAAGLLIDNYYFYLESGGVDAPFWLSYNFTITIPSYLLSLITIIHLFKIKNKTIVTVCSMIVSVLFMVFTFWFYAVKLGGSPTEFYGLVYVMGFVPALIIGLIYGLLISRRLAKMGV